MSGPETRAALPFGPADRARVAADVAGVLAEHAVAGIEVADPRFCRTRTLAPRTTNLPAELLAAAPGTVFRAPGLVLMVDAGTLHWAAAGGLALDLSSVARAPSP